MTPDDYEQVSALWQATEGLGLDESREEFCRILAHNPGLSPVVRIDGRIAAAVFCCSDGRRGYLYHLAVAREHRGRGIAKAVVDHCLQRLAALGIARCSIHLYVDNPTGEQFWKKVGWRNRVDLKVMAIDL